MMSNAVSSFQHVGDGLFRVKYLDPKTRTLRDRYVTLSVPDEENVTVVSKPQRLDDRFEPNPEYIVEHKNLVRGAFRQDVIKYRLRAVAFVAIFDPIGRTDLMNLIGGGGAQRKIATQQVQAAIDAGEIIEHKGSGIIKWYSYPE